MAGTPRPRQLLLAGIATLLGLGTLATGAQPASAGTLTVTFHAAQNVQCGTAPSVGSLTVPDGTPVQFLNRSGHDGTLVVGGEDEPLPKNVALELTIAVGQYDVRLVEDCGSADLAQPVTVTVTGAAPTSASSTPAGAPPATVPVGGTSLLAEQEGAGAAAAGRPAASGGGVASPAQPGAGSTATPSGTAGSRAPTTGPNLSPVLAATTILLDSPERHPKDVRLLALVATICVLGVTAAIIRSIVRLSP